MTASATSTTTGAGSAAGQNDKNGNNQGKGNASDQNDDDSSGGLSTGAQAGIGVGVAIAGLAIIAAIVFFCLRRRKSNKITKPKSDPEAEQMTQNQDYRYAAVPAYPGSPSNQAQGDHKQPMPYELNPEQRVEELGAGMQSPQELAVNDTRAELDDNQRI